MSTLLFALVLTICTASTVWLLTRLLDHIWPSDYDEESVSLEAMDRDDNAQVMAALERARVETRERVVGER